MTTERMVVCPKCAGKGAGVSMACGTKGMKLTVVPCWMCRGEKALTTGRATELEHRAQVRQSRIDRQESIREAAARLGMTPASYGMWERGTDV